MSPCYSLHSPSLFFLLPPLAPSPLHVHKPALQVCLCAFAKIQGSSPTPTFIFSPLSHQLLLALPPNAPRAWPIPLFLHCSSSNQDTITSALDPNVAFQLITLFSFLPQHPIWPRDNHSNLQKASIFLLTKHSKASHWFQNKIPSLTMVYKACSGQIPVFYLIPLYMGYTHSPQSPLYSSPLAFSPPSNMPLHHST